VNGGNEMTLENHPGLTRRTLHRVAVAKGYFLGTGPVTQAPWPAVMGGNPGRFRADDLPVEGVSWDDCQDFCRKLGEGTGRRFRLPTEAEWEHAACAGTTTPFFFGETIAPDRANYDGSPTGVPCGVYRERTTLVGTFPPNAWGLFDMHGNVFEWRSGRYGERAGGGWPRAGGQRVMRGGSWFDRPMRCRSAYRYWVEPGRRDEQVGCRLVLCKG
jgi:formylglycine-generating enzyme required for sulfatase activity